MEVPITAVLDPNWLRTGAKCVPAVFACHVDGDDVFLLCLPQTPQHGSIADPSCIAVHASREKKLPPKLIAQNSPKLIAKLIAYKFETHRHVLRDVVHKIKTHRTHAIAETHRKTHHGFVGPGSGGSEI